MDRALLNAAEITAICTGVPAILAAVLAIINSFKAKNTAAAAKAQVAEHITNPDMHPLAPTSFQERTGISE